MTAIRIKSILPVIFLCLVIGGALLILFPAPAAALEPTHDPYEPPPEPDEPYNPADPYYTGDLAGTAFQFWGVTSSGDVLIADMEDFNLFGGSVYYGENELTNVYVTVLCSYDTEGFVYNDPEHPLTLTGVIGVHDWTAYEISALGGNTGDAYNLPYSLYGFYLPGEVYDWVQITYLGHSPNPPDAGVPVTVQAQMAGGSGDEVDFEPPSDVLSYPDEDSGRFQALALGSMRLSYSVDGAEQPSILMIEPERTAYWTANIPGQPAGAVVRYTVTASYGYATTTKSGTYTVAGTPALPPTITYYVSQYASDADRYGYEKMSITTQVSVERTQASGTDINVGRVYLLDNGDDSPHLFSYSNIDAWYNWAWFSVWQEYAGEDLPDDGILRTYLRAYVNIEGYVETSTGGYTTDVIQSEWSSTVGINLATAPGITGVGSQTAMSAFGSTGGGLPFLPTLLMMVGGIGFIAMWALPSIVETIRR